MTIVWLCLSHTHMYYLSKSKYRTKQLYMHNRVSNQIQASN